MTDAADTQASVPRQLPIWVLAVLSAGVSALHTLPMWFGSMTADIDESFMLMAGVRLWSGQGFTTDHFNDWEDLAEPKFEYEAHWPPGLGYLFAGLLTLAGNVETAYRLLVAVKSVTVAVGWAGWYRLGEAHLPPVAAAIYGLGLAGVFFPDSLNPTHWLVWAVIPIWLSTLLAGLQRRRLWLFASAGALAALAVGFRYGAVVLAPAAGAGVLVLGSLTSESGRLRRAAWSGVLRCGLWPALLAAVPPAATFVGLRLWNAANSPHGSPLETSPIGWDFVDTWQWERLGRIELLTFWLAFGFDLNQAVYKLRPSLQTRLSPVAFAPWYGLLIGLAAATVWMGRFRDWSLTNSSGRLLVLVMLASGANLAMLAYMETHLPSHVVWQPLAWRRYHSELLPGVALLWLVVLAAAVGPLPELWHRLRAGRPAPLSIAAVLVLLVVLGLELRAGFRQLRITLRETAHGFAHHGQRPLERAVIDLLAAHAPQRHLIFDAPTHFAKDLHWRPGLSAHGWVDPDTLTRAARSKPTLLLVIVRWKPPPAEQPNARITDSYYTQRGDAIRQAFALTGPPTVVVEDNGHLCEVYLGWLPIKPVPLRVGGESNYFQKANVRASLENGW